MDEKISVIIPVYNVSKYLKRCLDSIINNTYKNLEIICIDDGSTDDSDCLGEGIYNGKNAGSIEKCKYSIKYGRRLIY